MRSRRLRLSLVAIAVLPAAGLPVKAALGQGAARQTASVLFNTERPGAGTGLTIKIAYRNPSDPNAKPFAVQRIVSTLAPGTRIDTSVPVQCKATDAQLTAGGAGACPTQSLVGGGTVTVDSGSGVVPMKATLINNANELIFLTETTSGPPARTVIRSPIRGTTITNDVPGIPGGPPDGYTAIRDVDLKVTAQVSMRNGRLASYITTPPACPRARTFANSGAFTYRDGVRQLVASPSPCKPLDRRPPRVAVHGVPRHGCAGGSLRATVAVRDRSGVRRVTVRLGRRLLRSTSRRRFKVGIPARLIRPGRNSLFVRATDRAGNRTRLRVRFVGCA